MNYKLIFIIIIGFFFTNCASFRSEKKLEGVWYFDNKLLSKNGSFDIISSTNSIIFDFNKKGFVKLNFIDEESETTYKWKIKNEYLYFDSVKYKIIKINNDSVVFVDGGYNITLKKTKNHSINYTLQEINEILLSNIWETKDDSSTLEYFTENLLLRRENIFDSKTKESSYFFYLDKWKIIKYDKYFFIYNFLDNSTERLANNQINQILSINSDSYSIIENYPISKEREYTSIEEKNNRIDYQEKIMGEWISSNSKSKLYEIPYEIKLKNAGYVFFEGILKFDFRKSGLFCSIDDIIYSKNTKWFFSKDFNSIIFKEPYEINDKLEYFYTCARILNLSDTTMKLRLYNTTLFSTNEYGNTQTIFLNKIQEFIKK